MKKKSSLILSLVALTTLAACGGGTSETDKESVTEKPSVTEPTTDPVAGKITFLKDSYVVERNNTVSIRVKVAIPGASNLTCSFTVEQDGEIVQLPEMTEGVIAINVKGLTIGKAKIIATSMANPAITASTEVEVIRPLYNLGQAWKKAVGNTNYTLTSKDENGDVHNIVKVTDAGITATKGDGTANYVVEDVQDHGTVNLYGLAIDTTGDAFYLMEDSTGLYNTGISAQGQGVGPLNKDNFRGLGLQAASWLDVDSSFYGIQAINPQWLTAEKDPSNTYEIVGTESEFNSAMVEALLWKLIDPTGLEQYLKDNGITSYTAQDIAVKVNTTLTVNRDNSVTIQLENHEKKLFTASLSDVGSTVLDTRFTDYAASVNVELPPLNATVSKIKDSFLKDDFYLNMTSGGETMGAYHTADYLYNVGMYNFQSIANQLGVSKVDGFVNKGDSLYPFYLDEAQEVVVVGKTLGKGTVKDLIPYPSSYNTFKEENQAVLYGFTEYPNQSGSGNVYISRNQIVSDDFASGFYGMTVPEICKEQGWTFDGYLTEFTPTLTKSETGDYVVTNVDVSCGLFNGGYVLVPFSFNMEGCAKINPIDAKIKAAVAAFSPAA